VYRQQVKGLMGGPASAVLCLGLLMVGRTTSASTAGRVFRAGLPAGSAALPVGIGVAIFAKRKQRLFSLGCRGPTRKFADGQNLLVLRIEH